MAKLCPILRVAWDYLRELFGEKAYTRYCDHVVARGGQPMALRDFYLWQQQQKYSRPCRCC